MIETRLVMGFNDNANKIFNLTLRDARSDLDTLEVKGSMDKIINADVFDSRGHSLVSPCSAKLITTETKELFKQSE